MAIFRVDHYLGEPHVSVFVEGLEVYLSIRRGGADLILTYFAKQAAQVLGKKV